jgi:hypothetical protein
MFKLKKLLNQLLEPLPELELLLLPLLLLPNAEEPEFLVSENKSIRLD